ncbi:hypothetical protein Tco_0909887 [Tanacetum coccineum]|uniref:Uncharacterized protein n=1 Tax=Tanacetum coccineum TaxID=301880 RepID=A0ABQ5CU27_9ASTR
MGSNTMAYIIRQVKASSIIKIQIVYEFKRFLDRLIDDDAIDVPHEDAQATIGDTNDPFTSISMSKNFADKNIAANDAYILIDDIFGKNKTGFIDGSYKRSNTDEVLGRRAKHVCEELMETYDKVDGSITFGLHHKIHTLKQNGSSIADYYHKLNAMWKQFDAMIELRKCTCHAVDNLKNYNKLIKLMQFLMGLDDYYMQIRSSILSREVLPDVRCAYATISSEESHRVASGSIAGSSQKNQAYAFVSNIIGYPVDFGKKKLGQNVKGKNISNNNSVGSSSSSGFTDEQMTTLISLIKDNKVERMCRPIWQSKMISDGKIVNSSANQHMTNTDKELNNVYDISHIKIKVDHPNGTKALISKIGNLRLPNGLVLFDVLVVTKYYVSLISVHKLAKDNKILVAFDESRCIS